MAHYRFTDADRRAGHQTARLNAKPRSTRGKTWDEIYGPEYAAIKREQVAAVSRSIPPETRERANSKQSVTKRRQFAAGEVTPSFTGREHSAETRAKISRVRREKYGTRASINKQVRYTQHYRQWRTAIFERDGYTCQDCGAHTAKERGRVILEVHHKVELWSLIGSQSFDEAMNDPAVWDDDNGVTLCQPCHRKIPVGAYWELIQ